jgi:predicted nucleic acid-binding Zn ribbon protein
MTYQYYCKYCKTYMEIECKVSEYESEVQCGCGGSAKRVYSPTRVLYKCSGFFTTDSKEK